MQDVELSYTYAFENFKKRCEALIREFGVRTVCEIGGGRAPLFSAEEIEALGLDYSVLDASQSELDQAPANVNKVCKDICDPVSEADRSRYDLIFSKFLAEHVSDGKRFHRNVHDMLRPGGVAFHFYPTLYHPAFIANRMLPEKLTFAILSRVFGYPKKFPATYAWCYGPTPKMLAFLKDVGYEVVEFRPFYGTYYFEKFPGVRAVDRRFTAWTKRNRSARLSSYAWLVVRRPAAV